MPTAGDVFRYAEYAIDRKFQALEKQYLVMAKGLVSRTEQSGHSIMLDLQVA